MRIPQEITQVMTQKSFNQWAKHFFSSPLLYLSLLVTLILSTMYFMLCLEKQRVEYYNSFIGREIVIESDTVTITAYRNDGNFYTSKGIIVSSNLVEQQLNQ